MSIRKSLKKVLPPISVTEQEALDAGDIWLEASIYQGKPDMQALRAIPQAKLSADEQAFIDGPVQELLGLIDDFELANGKHIPDEILAFLKKHRFFSMIIPKKFGGLEFSPYANSTIVATIAAKSGAIAVTVMVPNSLGPGELLMHYGTKEQQDYYLPRLAVGDDIPCFALTSPEAGSDAGGIPDAAIVTKGEWEGKEVIGLKVSWDKRYITLAPIATVLGLAFKVFDPDQLLGEKLELGITCALLPKSHPGVELGNRHDPMGQRFYNGTTRGNDVFIPMDFIIGGQKNIGRGWQMLVSCLGAGRGISLPAMGVATGQAALKASAEYSFVREQFGLPIGRFEGIQGKLADIAGKTFLLESMRVLTTEGLGLGLKPSVVTAIAKYHMTELGRDVMNSAMDILAGKAIQRGPQNTLSGGYSSLPIAITVEGANILTRNLMIFGQGAMRCHPYLKEMVDLIHSDDHSADGEFNKVLKKTVSFSVKNAFRSLGKSYLPFLRGAESALPEVTKYEKRLNALSAKLAPMADLSLAVLGGDLKKAELLSARLGDVMSYLYGAMAAIRFYEQRVEDRKLAQPYFEYAMEWTLQQAEQALVDFIGNFPNTATRGLMRLLTCTYTNSVSGISDKLSCELALASMQDNSIKAQLTHLVRPVAGDGNDINEQAFKAKHAVAHLLGKVQKALRKEPVIPFLSFENALNKLQERGVVTAQEAEMLHDYNKKRKLAVRVDEFNFDLEPLSQEKSDSSAKKDAA
ncbi:acyl-CoA dehydrogenase [Alteromonas sp. RKMC-009]|uniref:acyl-CoA dehydrogenase n=1 Tax=Alteromonas sp. RKMC-009 TaxID=2267264 RepID=UPI000E688A24|nr:acyl-CoA dehydrogenase [Alteromonas sp. RKMC-009]AYA65213.1 acyl-CoA dehydrogenase [Alteromonas sp. RKMC-009]MEC7691925.1 acyl-CoA dehydrogenase [Pseudomonadota bacterium]